MATLISDDGQIATFQTDDGRTVRVASQFAQPYIDPPSQGGELAPPGAIDEAAAGMADPVTGAPAYPEPLDPMAPPVSVQDPQAPLLGAPQGQPGALAQPAIPPPPEMPAVDAVSGAGPIVPGQPEPAPPMAAPGPAVAPEPQAEPPPSVMPTGQLRSPTQTANAINQTLQERSDSAHRAVEAQASATDEMIQQGEALDGRIEQQEQQRRIHAAVYQEEERHLTDSFGKMVDRYANWKADPTRGISGDRMAWAWVAAAIAGLGSALKGRGDQNPALQALMGNLDRNVQLQMAERDTLGNAIDMKRQEIVDFRGAAKNRLAEYDLRMAGELERYGRLVDRIKTKLGSEIEREAANQLSSQLKAEATQRKAGAVGQEAQMRARAAAARAAALQKAREAAQKEAQFRATNKVRWDPATQSYVPDERFAGPATVEGREQIAKTIKAEADASQAVLDASTEERVRKFGIGGITRKDGTTPVLAGSPEEARTMRDAKAGVDMASHLIDKMLIARNRYGWSSDLFKSDEWRQMQADFAQLQLIKKAPGMDALGVLTGPDLDIIGKSLGTTDPTEVRDPSAGLKEARSNIVNQFNTKLRSQDPASSRYEPPRMAVAKAIERTKEENAKVLTAPIPAKVGDESTEEARQQMIEDKRASLDPLLRQKPSADELVGWAKEIDKQVKAGSLTQEEAYSIVNGMAVPVIGAEQRRVQELSVDELKKLQKDPGFSQRARIVNLAKSGGARPEEIYRLLVEGGK